MGNHTFKIQYRKKGEKNIVYEVRWEKRNHDFDVDLEEIRKRGINFNEIDVVKFDYFIDDCKRLKINNDLKK